MMLRRRPKGDSCESTEPGAAALNQTSLFCEIRFERSAADTAGNDGRRHGCIKASRASDMDAPAAVSLDQVAPCAGRGGSVVLSHAQCADRNIRTM